MSIDLHYFTFQVFPYIALVVLIFGSIVRFDRDPYTWTSKSSQLLRRGWFVWGNIMFHIGILVILFGHLFGLLTPLWIFHALGIEPETKQWMAIIGGGIAGVLALAGLTLLIARRLLDPRIRKNSSFWDTTILFFILAQLLLGLYTIPASIAHAEGGTEMLKYMNWAQGIVTFDPEAASYIRDVPWQFKTHIALGLTIFLVSPFTRLVHFWSAPLTYIFRRQYQIVRKRRA